MQSPRTFRSFWLPKLIIAAVVAAAIALMSMTGIGCPIRFLFGIPCPGCGTTRACAAALHGDFIEALRWQPLFPIAVPGFIYIALGEYPLFGSVRRETVFCILAGVLLLAVYIARMFFAERLGLHPIEPGEGVVLKLFHRIFERCLK